MTDNHVDLKDFSIAEKRISFRVDEDIFNAYTVLSIPAMQDLANLSEDIAKLVETKNYEPILKIFDVMLEDASAVRFRERLAAKNGDDALDLRKQVIPILHYLLERYGLRPTQQSSD